MQAYPSLPSWSQAPGIPCYVFDKLDGSNVSCEVTRKGGITKFAKRDGLLDEQTPFLIQAATLIPEKYGDDLQRILRAERWDKATFYFEFYGPSSSFGWHKDEPHTVTLIDAAVHKHGFLEPREFLRVFKNVEHAALLHQGNFTREVADAVANSTLDGMTFEGVVAKGAWDRKKEMPLMFKWKSLAWLKKLHDVCGEDEALFARLA